MAKTDVVKHDLEPTLDDEVFDWESAEPMPLPVIPGRHSQQQPSPQLAEPTTTLVPAKDLTRAPYQSVGKMGLVIGGKRKTASGWVVARRAFITAGHCVYHPDFGGWITKAFFCPRYDNQCTNRFIGTVVYTLKGWVEDHDPAYEIAACVITENFATSEPPLAFDSDILTPDKFAAIGYPTTPIPKHQFNGERMWQSVGAYVSEKDDVIWAENNLTNGASGGPWWGTDPQGNYRVYGLTEERAADPNQAASPGLWVAFDYLYNAVKSF